MQVSSIEKKPSHQGLKIKYKNLPPRYSLNIDAIGYLYKIVPVFSTLMMPTAKIKLKTGLVKLCAAPLQDLSCRKTNIFGTLVPLWSTILQQVKCNAQSQEDVIKNWNNTFNASSLKKPIGFTLVENVGVSMISNTKQRFLLL